MAFWIFCSRHLPLHVPSPHFHLLQMYCVLTVWWGHFTFFRHFSGNSFVLVLPDFFMNFRMHLSNFKNNSLVIFYGHCFPLTWYPYIQYIMLIIFLSGNVFLCDVRDWTSVTLLLGKCSTADLCPLETWYVPRNMYMFLQIDLACFLHDFLPRYFCLL